MDLKNFLRSEKTIRLNFEVLLINSFYEEFQMNFDHLLEFKFVNS